MTWAYSIWYQVTSDTLKHLAILSSSSIHIPRPQEAVNFRVEVTHVIVFVAGVHRSKDLRSNLLQLEAFDSDGRHSEGRIQLDAAHTTTTTSISRSNSSSSVNTGPLTITSTLTSQNWARPVVRRIIGRGAALYLLPAPAQREHSLSFRYATVCRRTGSRFVFSWAAARDRGHAGMHGFNRRVHSYSRIEAAYILRSKWTAFLCVVHELAKMCVALWFVLVCKKDTL